MFYAMFYVLCYAKFRLYGATTYPKMSVCIIRENFSVLCNAKFRLIGAETNSKSQCVLYIRIFMFYTIFYISYHAKFRMNGAATNS